MKDRDKQIIKEMNYSENDFAKKILRSVRRSDKILYLIFILNTITYILIMINAKISLGSILITILYIIISVDLSLSQKKYLNKMIKETKNKMVCPEAFFNLNLYNANKIICSERSYNYYLNNIANFYIQVGNTEKAEKIIKYLDNKKKNLILQSQIIQNKIEIAFVNNDIKKMKMESENLRKILVFIPKKYRQEAKLNINLKQAVVEKDKEKVNELCNELEKKKEKYNKIFAAYYRGVIEEKEEKQKEYYQFVADNGNNLKIANEARKKFKISDIKIVYERKKHIFYKAFQTIVMVLFLLSTIFWIAYTVYVYFRMNS